MLVQKRVFQIKDLLLYSGHTLRDVEFGYETYGSLNDPGDNAILVAHHFSGTSHAAGRYDENDAEPGYWDTLIGPGKAIDTERWFVVSCETLCNLNTKMPHVVTTGPASIKPETGRPYGSSFPVVTIGDFVAVQKALCDHLGVKKLHAVAGPSMGSLQAMEWAASFPEMVERVISAIPAGLATEPFLIAMLESWCAPIRLDPDFNNGEYYGQREPIAGLTQALKLVTLTALHHDWALRLFKRRWADAELDPLHSLDNMYAVERALMETAAARAAIADANSFLRLCRAVQLFDVRDKKDQIKAKFLVIPAENDLLMFPAYAERGVKELRELGLSVKTATLYGKGGHLDGLNVIDQAAEEIREFLNH